MYVEPVPAASGTGHGPGHYPTAAMEIAPLARPSALILTVLGLSLLAVVWLGIYPAPLLDFIDGASRSVLPGG
jgi:hypothetical protein